MTNQVRALVVLLVLVLGLTAALEPRADWVANLENLQRRTALFGLLGLGVSVVILTGGIDLSVGSLVGLVGVVLGMWVGAEGLHPALAIGGVLLLATALGIGHGLLVTRLDVQPFVVTLCGLLAYRGVGRWLTSDRPQSFGSEHPAWRALADGKPLPLWTVALVLGLFGAAAVVRSGRRGGRALLGPLVLTLVGASGAVGLWPLLGRVRAVTPFLVLVACGLGLHVLLTRTVWGRHLFALGQNETAARYAGIPTGRRTVQAYALCGLLSGLGGVFFALDLPSVQPAAHGNFYELYAIAAAVLGGFRLRGGEGTVLGVLLGTAVLRSLLNAVNLLEFPRELEFAILGAVILLGAVGDELVRRWLARRASRAALRGAAGAGPGGGA